MKLQDILIDKIYDRNRENIESLRKKMKESELAESPWVVCLGAGVSISCGLPNWTKLLAMISGQLLHSYNCTWIENNELLGIIAEAIENEKDEHFKERMDVAAEGGDIDIYAGIDPLELAEYIRTQIKEMIVPGEDAGEDEIDDMLRVYIKNCFRVERESDQSIKGYSGSTLEAVVWLMKEKKIRRAITYNYDDLLETALKLDGKNVETILPGDRKEFSGSDGIYRVYHCHGLISLDASEDPQDRKIILTESSYYNEESKNYSLSNVLQAYSMNYCNLLYIGFSGVDYTFRRIIRGLDRTKHEIRHSIFFSADDVFNMVYKSRPEEDKAIGMNEYIEQIKDGKREYEKLMMNHIIVSKTLYWEEKGMNVIWSTHEELAGILKGL